MTPLRTTRSPTPWICGVAAVALLSPIGVRGYDTPDFGAHLFSADGIFLAEDERSSLLEALTAIASNFPGNARVDDDLREKALALSLCLDPLHYASRLAHRELIQGAIPKPTPYFDSLASVSETLWRIGLRLAEPPIDPEERRLAPFVLELSLLAHPEPPEDRLVTFAEITGPEPIAWEPAVRLQRDGNPSTVRARDLFANAQLRNQERRSKLAAAAPTNGASPATPEIRPVAGRPVPPGLRPVRPAPIEPRSASLMTVREVVVEEGNPTAGRVTLTIREPRGGPERNYLAGLGPNSPFPLIPSLEAIPVVPFAVPTTLGKDWSWPAGGIGEVRFDPGVPLDGPRRLFRTNAVLPSLVLLDCLLGKKAATNETVVLLGEIDPETMQVSLPGDLISMLEAGSGVGYPYVLVPSTVLDPLVSYLQSSQRLELLFRSELIGYNDLAGAVAHVTSAGDPALAAASASFGEIKKVSKDYALPDLARLPSAQEKLREILATFPDHLSARAMLEFGTRPVTAEILKARFVAEVDAIVKPFLGMEDPTADMQALLSSVDVAESLILRLRPRAPVDGRDLLGAAEDLVNASELYLQITNKGTSIGQQRLREARAAIGLYDGERAKLTDP